MLLSNGVDYTGIYVEFQRLKVLYQIRYKRAERVENEKVALNLYGIFTDTKLWKILICKYLEAKGKRTWREDRPRAQSPCAGTGDSLASLRNCNGLRALFPLLYWSAYSSYTTSFPALWVGYGGQIMCPQVSGSLNWLEWYSRNCAPTIALEQLHIPLDLNWMTRSWKAGASLE